jgi:hypothetical protein
MVTELVEVLKLGLPVEVGVLNPFIYDKVTLIEQNRYYKEFGI